MIPKSQLKIAVVEAKEQEYLILNFKEYSLLCKKIKEGLLPTEIEDSVISVFTESGVMTVG